MVTSVINHLDLEVVGTVILLQDWNNWEALYIFLVIKALSEITDYVFQPQELPQISPFSDSFEGISFLQFLASITNLCMDFLTNTSENLWF